MTTNQQIIYLDMDGVCADFTTASIKANGFEPASMLETWARDFPGVRNGYEVMGIEREAYWQAIASGGEAYWTNLIEYPWFDPLYRALKELAPVIFLSSPSRSPSCLSGKLRWLQTRFSPYFRDYIFTTHKHLLAGSNRLLIDDDEGNVDKFQAAGGKAVLFPQVWNRHHGLEDRLEYTLQQVQHVLES